MLKDLSSISQKITFPPKFSTTFAVEIHVNAGTITSSSLSNPIAASERKRPEVLK